MDGKLVATVTQAPYNYSIDTTSLRNGNYQLQTKTYFQDGSVSAKDTALIVKNPMDWNQFRLQARHYFLFVIVGILLIGALVWYLIQRRGDNWLNSKMKSPPYTPNNTGNGNTPTAHVGTM